MEIIKKKNENINAYDIILINDNKKLLIYFAGNQDLYMGIYNGQNIGLKNISLDFDITKENYEIYCIFDNLYNDITKGYPFGFYNNYKKDESYRNLIDENKNIIWISDEGPDEEADKMIISKIDDDTYRLTFVRNEIDTEFYMKCPDGISVRFRNSGSRYKPFNAVFMGMYQAFQNIDENYHQIHMEELIYTKKM